MTKPITVVTTTFNRAYCLHQVYESLCEQDPNLFVWLVVDDGSTDNTRDLIAKYSTEERIEIRYVYQPNGGMHSARNLGYREVATELNVMIDSDDWLVPGALTEAVGFWRSHATDSHAGMITLNVDPSGRIVGSAMPVGVSESTVGDFFGKHRGRGDKKLIYRSDLSRQYPYPEFEGETFFPASYKFRLIDRTHSMLVADLPVCVVDYNEDSMSRRKVDQYFESPRGFAEYRRLMLEIEPGRLARFRHAVHYVAESRIGGLAGYLRSSPSPVLCGLALPFGFLFHGIMRLRRRLRRR